MQITAWGGDSARTMPLTISPDDAKALQAFTRTALLTNRAQDALSWVKALTTDTPSVAADVATSKLMAAASLGNDALEVAKKACAAQPVAPAACEQLASLYADAGDAAQLESVVQTLDTAAPGAAPTLYYRAVLAFLKGDANAALQSAQQAIAADASYAAAYDMAGAAHTKLGQADLAAQAFQTSLRFDPHDSTAYTNLGVLALAAGQRDAARNYFAEALWLRADDAAALEGARRTTR